MKLATAVKQAIETQPGIVALLPGGIWDRPLVPPEVAEDVNPANDDEFIHEATEDAFNTAVIGQANRCVVIDVPDRTGPLFNWPDVEGDYVDVYTYGPDDLDSEALLRQARALIEAFLTARFLRPHGAGCRIDPAIGGYDFRDVPELVWTQGALDRYIAAWW